MAFNFPRPTYPIAGEFFLGSLMFAWGLWVLVFPGSPHSGGYSLRWFWNLGEERAVAAAATGLGIFKIMCAYMVWSKGGKIAATLAAGFWLQLGVEGYTAAPHVHPPVCALYFGAALCSLFIIWAEMNESDPNAFTSLIDLLQQFKTFAVGVVALGVYRGIRMWLNDLGDKDSKADRKDKAETKDWLSQQDRRFRDVVDRTNADNVRLLERNGKLEGEMMAKDAEIDRERKSGMHHYQVSVDIYQYAQGLVHDWRNGQNPPDKMKKFEDF